MYHFLPTSTFHVPIILITTIHVSFTKIHFTGPSNSTCYPITQLIQNQRLRFILPYLSQSPSLNFHLPHYRRFYQHFTKAIISFFCMQKTTMKNMKRHSSESSLRRVDSPVGAVTKLENVHRRRLKIRRMKYSCQAKIHVGNGSDDGGQETENARREIHESVEISLSLATSSSSEEDDQSSKQNGEVQYC